MMVVENSEQFRVIFVVDNQMTETLNDVETSKNFQSFYLCKTKFEFKKKNKKHYFSV